MRHEESLGRWISHIHWQGQIHIGARLKQLGIGPGQFPVLITLYHGDGLNQGEIARTIRVDKATVTRDVKKLEEQGYVRRERDADDKRAYRVFLTQKAKRAKPKIMMVLKGWTDILSKDFAKEEVETALSLLKRMHENAVTARAEGED